MLGQGQVTWLAWNQTLGFPLRTGVGCVRGYCVPSVRLCDGPEAVCYRGLPDLSALGRAFWESH